MAEERAAPSIRILGAADAQAFRELRLEALAMAPASFGSSVEEERALSLDVFRARIASRPPSAVFGAFADQALVGIAGFLASEKEKKRHKGLLWGVYLKPGWRGRGIAESLVRHVIAHAARHVLVLQASVEATNEAARHIYERQGFVRYGLERRALCVEGVFYDEELLDLDLARYMSPAMPAGA